MIYRQLRKIKSTFRLGMIFVPTIILFGVIILATAIILQRWIERTFEVDVPNDVFAILSLLSVLAFGQPFLRRFKELKEHGK